MHELNLQEAAYLAALPKAPKDLHPFRNRERAIERRNYVIDRMVENGYVPKEQGDQAKKQPLGVNPRTISPNNFAAGYFAEEVRRELQDRYGEKKLYEGGLSVRSTLDPKMQLMARKALVDGLVRYDEARGWRGAIQKLDLGARDWGLALAEVPVLGDVAPWRLAVVLDVAGDTARLGLQPLREPSGQLKRDRETLTLGSDGIKWTRRGRVSQVVSVGDVVYVEPTEGGRSGQSRLRQLPEISGAIVAMDPFTGRVLAMVGGFSFDQSRVQPRDAGDAPARLVLQALRLRDGARQWLHAVEHHPRRADRDRSGRRSRRSGGRRTSTASRPARVPCATASSIPRT